MENDILDSLTDLGYGGPLTDEAAFSKALDGGHKSLEYTKLVHILAEELKKLCNVEETVNIMNDPDESSTFLLELSSFLKELGCPYKKLITGHMSSRLQTKEERLLLLDYMISELMAARMVKVDCPKEKVGSSMDIVVHETPTAKDLKEILILLKFNKPPPNITTEMLFTKLEAKLKETMQKEGEKLVGKPLYNKALSEKEWKQLEESFTEMFEEYRIRRETLITRLECTIQSFEWSDRLKTKKDIIQSTYRPKREQMKVKPDIRLSDFLAARTDLLQVEKTSNANVRKNTQSDVNKVIIGQVPDRGGRPNEAQPPPPEMPSWQQRSSAPQMPKTKPFTNVNSSLNTPPSVKSTLLVAPVSSRAAPSVLPVPSSAASLLAPTVSDASKDASISSLSSASNISMPAQATTARITLSNLVSSDSKIRVVKSEITVSPQENVPQVSGTIERKLSRSSRRRLKIKMKKAALANSNPLVEESMIDTNLKLPVNTETVTNLKLPVNTKTDTTLVEVPRLNSNARRKLRRIEAKLAEKYAKLQASDVNPTEDNVTDETSAAEMPSVAVSGFIVPSTTYAKATNTNNQQTPIQVASDTRDTFVSTNNPIDSAIPLVNTLKDRQLDKDNSVTHTITTSVSISTTIDTVKTEIGTSDLAEDATDSYYFEADMQSQNLSSIRLRKNENLARTAGQEPKVPRKRILPIDHLTPDVSKRPKPNTVPSTSTDSEESDLRVAVVMKPYEPMTKEQALTVAEALEECIFKEIDALVDSNDNVYEAPRFRGKPFPSEGVLKLRGVDSSTVEWLHRTVEQLSPRSGSKLVVIRQSDIPRKFELISAHIFLPGYYTADKKEFHIQLQKQNPCYDIEQWTVYFSPNQKNKRRGLFVGLKIPPWDVRRLLENDCRVTYELKSFFVRLNKGVSYSVLF